MQLFIFKIATAAQTIAKCIFPYFLLVKKNAVPTTAPFCYVACNGGYVRARNLAIAQCKITPHYVNE